MLLPSGTNSTDPNSLTPPVEEHFTSKKMSAILLPVLQNPITSGNRGPEGKGKIDII